MGKRKQDYDEYTEEPSSRQHRKHKKRRSRQDDYQVTQSVSPAETPTVQPSIKLKIKIGGQTVGSTSFSVADGENSSTCGELSVEADDDDRFSSLDVSVDSDSVELSAPPTVADVTECSDEEDDEYEVEEKQWLDALESGDLDNNGDLKRDKDTSLLTARQRALLHGQRHEQLIELPTFGKQCLALSEEQISRRQQRAKKRRERAHEKTEKDKKQTLDRLLKKQDSKAKGQIKSSGRADARQSVPKYTYVNNATTVSISVPNGFEFPLQQQIATLPTAGRLCGVDGCTNARRYSCSRTGTSLCSLRCYKKNLNTLQDSRLQTV